MTQPHHHHQAAPLAIYQPAVQESAFALKQRLRWVARFRRLIAAHERELCKLVTEEINKPEHEVLTGELYPLLAACRWHERHAANILKPRPLRHKALWQIGQRHRVLCLPLGHVGIIATWNYPLQLLGIQLVQAIVAGNRVMVKPSERSPRSQLQLLELARQAGLPDGILQWCSADRDAGPAMLREHLFDHILFTGSTAVGREIAAYAAERLIPTTLELSGCDSAFVLADADVQLAAKTIWAAVTMNAGQTCMAPRRVLVYADIYRAFLDALAPLVSAAKPVRVIDEHAAERVWTFVRDAIDAGGRMLSGVCEPPVGSSLRPYAVVDCPHDAALVRGEHFGPAVAVVSVPSVEAALAVHRRCDQHLATSIFTSNRQTALTLATQLTSGTITINDCILPVAHPGASLGGHAQSGWGRSQGCEGLHAMTRSVHCSMTSRWIRPSVQTPSTRIVQRLRQLLHWLYGPATSGSETVPSPPASTATPNAMPSKQSLQTTLAQPKPVATPAPTTPVSSSRT